MINGIDKILMQTQTYTGAVIEESLKDLSILKKVKILKTSVTIDENPIDRWHIHKVESTKNNIIELSKYIKDGQWYAHFWNENKDIVAVFRDKIFEFNYDNKDSWQPAIEYGLSVGIPIEQLDFLID